MNHLTELAWSVVTMNDVIRTDLTYPTAKALADQLSKDKTLTGVCVVSNNVAQTQLENTARRNRKNADNSGHKNLAS